MLQQRNTVKPRTWHVVALLLALVLFVVWVRQLIRGVRQVTNELSPSKDIFLPSQPQEASIRNNTDATISKNIYVVQSKGAFHAHLNDIATTLARTFTPTRYTDWCTHDNYLKNTNTSSPFFLVNPTGLLYVKTPKTGSSTIAGVLQRVSRRGTGVPCDHLVQHVFGAGRHYGNRNPRRSLLISSIREPAERAMSRVFYRHVSIKNKDPTDENVRFLLDQTSSQYGAVSQGQGGFQTNYLALHDITPWSHWTKERPNHVMDPDKVISIVKEIMDGFDIIILKERLEESLVVLQLLLEVDIGDILSTSSKVGGMYTFHKKLGCVHLTKSFISPVIQEYLDSSTWLAQNYGDYLLYKTVNISLDSTIQFLGTKRVEQGIAKYRHLMELGLNHCDPYVIFPCSANGTDQHDLARQSCYNLDEGCGYQCLNELVQNQSLNKLVQNQSRLL